MPGLIETVRTLPCAVGGPLELTVLVLEPRDVDVGAGLRPGDLDLGDLASDEVARAARFRYDADRRRFVCRRLAVRRLLAVKLGCAPSSVRFELGPFGKPCITWPRTVLQFSVSSSSDVVLLAVGETPLGVDVERVRPTPDLRAAETFMTAREVADWLSLRDDDATRAFYSCWTRKEAVLKASGVGLRGPSPRELEVGFAGDGSLRLAGEGGAGAGPGGVVDLHPAPGYAGALAFGPLRETR